MSTLRCWLFGHEWAATHEFGARHPGRERYKYVAVCPRCDDHVIVSVPNYRYTGLTPHDISIERSGGDES